MSELKVTREGATAVVTVANPGKRNAISVEMWRAIPGLFESLARDPDVRCVVITGEGEDFSAGADIAGLGSPGNESMAADAESAIAAFPKPVIAAIRGYCLGGGCQLALASDLRIAADDARFGIPPANLGLVYPLPGTRHLLDVVGLAAAKKLLFTAERIDAAEALRIGLVDELHPGDGVLPRALELAALMDAKSQLTIQASKAILRALAHGDDAEAVAAEWIQTCFSPEGDLTEGRAAFLEKRPARFTWQNQ